MGLISTITKRISGVFATPRPEPRPDRIVNFFEGWLQSTGWQQTAYRNELVQQYRGWSYVAIDARSAESACLTPKVCRIVDGDEVDGDYRKSLRQAKSLVERDDIRAAHYRKYVNKSLKRKALANLQDSDELEQVGSHHPLVKLLKRPNNHDVAYTFFYRIPMFLRLSGVCYIWVVPNLAGRPVQLWVLPPQWVREFATDKDNKETDKLIGSYEIRPTNSISIGVDYGQGWFGGGGAAKRVDESEVIKIAYPNPMSLTDSYSPQTATSAWGDVSNAIDSSRVQALVNGAYPGVVLELDKEMEAPSDIDLQSIIDRFSEKAAGVRNNRKPYVLAPGMTLVPSPWQSPVELDHTNSATQIRDSLLAAHRTGPTIAGITEQTSFAADTAARQGFYHGTLRPDLKMIGEVLTERLATRFEEHAEELVIWWEDPTPEDPEFKLKKAQQLAALSANTPNEIREDFGQQPFEFGGDDPMGAMGQQPLPWNTGEQPMGMPGMDGSMGQQPGMDQGMGDEQNGVEPDFSVLDQLLGGENGDTNGKPPAGNIPSPLTKRLNGNGYHGLVDLTRKAIAAPIPKEDTRTDDEIYADFRKQFEEQLL